MGGECYVFPESKQVLSFGRHRTGDCFNRHSRARRTSRLPAGIWGGVHIMIEVANSSATIDYDCANGTITGPMTIRQPRSV